jgi:hypothetical protein
LAVRQRETETLQDEIGKANKNAGGNADENISAAGRGAERNRDKRDDEAGPGLRQAQVTLRFQDGTVTSIEFQMILDVIDFAQGKLRALGGSDGAEFGKLNLDANVRGSLSEFRQGDGIGLKET